MGDLRLPSRLGIRDVRLQPGLGVREYRLQAEMVYLPWGAREAPRRPSRSSAHPPHKQKWQVDFPTNV